MMKHIFFTLTLVFSLTISAEEIHVYTYNILSDSYLGLSKYEGTDPQVLEWQNRKWLILSRITRLNSDILCLQEVSRDSYTFFEEMLGRMGYIGTYGEDVGYHKNGVATFYLKEKMHPIEVKTILCEGSAVTTKQTTRAAIITSFALNDDTSLNVINTKMKWVSSDTPLDQHPAWRQSQFLLNEIVSQKPNEAWIITGDFNFTPDHHTHKLIESSGFTEPYKEEQVATYFGNGEIKKIDYLFHSKSLITKQLSVTQLSRNAPIPSLTEPSDHIPLGLTVIVEKDGRL